MDAHTLHERPLHNVTSHGGATGTETTVHGGGTDPTGPDPGRGTTAGAAPRAGRGARARRLAGDGVALLLLAAVLIYLAPHDGGRDALPALWVGLAGLAAVPALLGEVRGLGRIGPAILGTWGVGGVLSIALAVERSRFAEPTLILGLTPLVFLAARRVWRRSWGPTAVLAVVLIGLGRYWHRSYLQWWGHTLRGDGTPQWLALSWHNQSGALMGALGLLLGGAALVQRRIVGWGLGLAAAGALAGVWLSGSRGTVGMTVVALAVTALVAVRAIQLPWRDAVRAVGVRVGGLIAGTVGITLVLTAMAGGGQPLATRAESAVGSGLARLRHMSAAIGMFLDRPLTGLGPGSYRIMARDYTPRDANLTASAHNEYLEVLGEGGLLLGGALLAAAAVLAVLVVRALRGPGRRLDTAPTAVDLRGALTVGAAGAVSLLVAHAAVDFDWLYPVLPALAAIVAAVVVAGHRRRDGAIAGAGGPAVGGPGGAGPADRHPAPRRWVGPAAVVSVAVLLAAGVAGVAVQQRTGDARDGLSARAYATAPVPWDHQRSLGNALELMRRGDLTEARLAVARTRAWNPGVANVAIVDRMIAFEAGELTADGLLGAVPDDTRQFTTVVLVARQLARHGHTDRAVATIDDMLDRIRAFSDWGITDTVAEATIARTTILADAGRCAAARRSARQAVRRPALRDATGAEQALTSAADACQR